jgi:NTP pyrophosphatase (non-canonical NTP hydrolase)
MATQLKRITDTVLRFRDARDWKQFHNPKDLALALSIEAAELNELFLWKTADAADKKRVAEELADVFIYSLLLAHESGVDIAEAVKKKLRANQKKYPVKKAKGSARKYSEFTK